MKFKNQIPLFVLILLTTVLMFYYYGSNILNLNHFLLSGSGDGIKNYFTFVNKTKESTFLESTIMNYPYGESFLYLDCQPILTVILKPLAFVFPSILDYTVAITNFLMIFSFLFTAIFVYLIFLEVKVNPYYALCCALAISFLNPQITRMSGHFALAYSFFVPMTWYFYLRYKNSDRKTKWIIIVFVNNLLWFFVHAYLGMILVAFVITHYLVELIVNKSENGGKKSLLGIFLMGLAPLLIFWSFAFLTDSHVGRTTQPYGFFEYLSTPSSVFIPSEMPLGPWIKEHIPTDQKWEGLAYVGLLSIVVFFIFLVLTVKYKLKRKNSSIYSTLYNSSIISNALPASFLVLLISFGIPFIFGLQHLLDQFPVIKNFRGIGRFAWVFYYVFTISMCYIIFQLSILHPKNYFYKILLFILPASYLIESHQKHILLSPSLSVNENYFNTEIWNKEHAKLLEQIKPEQFQAIIPLPYYHIGSENFAKVATDKILKNSMIFAYHLNLPLVSNYSTRTSIKESKNLLETASPSFYSKDFQYDLKSKKPFLILHSNENLAEGEKELIEKSEKLYSDENFTLYSLSYEMLFQNSCNKELENFNAIKQTLVEKNGFLINQKEGSNFFMINSYDTLISPQYHFASGALSGKKSNNNLLCKIEPKKLEQDHEYVVSFWIYNKGENFGQDVVNTMIIIETNDPSTGQVNWGPITNPNDSYINDGDWTYHELSFICGNTELEYRVVLLNYNNLVEDFIVDDFLIRDKNLMVYKILESNENSILELYKNNHIIKRNK